MSWLEILQNTSLFAIAVTGISWTARRLGEFYLQRRFAVFQTSIDKSLEEHKSQLNLLLLKDSKLHEKRLEVLDSLYKKIVVLDRNMQAMTSELKAILGDAEKEERQRIDQAGNSYNDFLFFYTENKIYFSEKIVQLLDELRNKNLDSFNDYTFGLRFGISDRKYTADFAKRASDTVRKHIPPILAQIEVEFRKLLAVA